MFQDHPLNRIFDGQVPEDENEREQLLKQDPVPALAPWNANDPLRLKIGKAVTGALEQIDRGPIPHVAGGQSPRNWFIDLRPTGRNSEQPRVYRGRFAVVAGDPPRVDVNGDDEDDRPVVVIRERPFLDLLDNKRAAPAETEGSEIYELLIQGWSHVPSDGDTDHITDGAYRLFEDIRTRLAILQLDEDHPKRVFRIGARNNTVLSLDISDGTVESDENEVPGAYLRIEMQVIENLADSTMGD